MIAHRGASARAPENSLAALRAAASLGADAVELDVRATADGGFVVLHDETLAGIAVADLGVAQVRQHRLANQEPVPTLGEALAAVAPAVTVFVEVKGLPLELDDAFLAELDGGPTPERYHVHSFDHRIVRRLGERRPGLPRGILSVSYPVRPRVPLADAGAAALWQERALIDSALVATVHEAGAKLYAWTVNAETEMRRLWALGVDGLCTDHPDVARRVLEG